MHQVSGHTKPSKDEYRTFALDMTARWKAQRSRTTTAVFKLNSRRLILDEDLDDAVKRISARILSL